MNREGLKVMLFELYKGSDFPPGTVQPNEGIETPVASSVVSGAVARDESEDPMTKEREEKVESWMRDVMAFIRNIDLNNL